MSYFDQLRTMEAHALRTARGMRHWTVFWSAYVIIGLTGGIWLWGSWWSLVWWMTAGWSVYAAVASHREATKWRQYAVEDRARIQTPEWN